MASPLAITWHGHACFSLEMDGWRIVLDPYADGSVPGLQPLRLTAHAVYTSHSHGDHSYTQAVELQSAPGPSPWRVTPIPSFHDDAQGSKRGPNTIHLLEAGEFRVAHMGDIGCALTPEQQQALSHLDALLLPVGGFYTIGPAEASAMADSLSPRVVIPMHYRTDDHGLAPIGRLEDFLALRKDVTVYSGNSITLTADTPVQTAVLQYVP